MKCNSCSEDVPAKFQHAISINSCPLCGEHIVDPNVQIIINDLKAVLNKASEHMDQIEDWLFTNFQLRKLKEDEIVINKNELPATVRDEERQGGGKPKPLRRANGDVEEGVGTGQINPKNAIEFIKKGGAGGLADPSLYVGTDDEGNEIDLASEAGDGLNRNELGQMTNLFGDGMQIDPKESARADAHLQKLKSLRRG
jgi:hypothetical protein